MSQIIINGKSYSGSNISIINGNVIIDGKGVSIDEKQISIVVNGDLAELDANGCNKIEIAGNVNRLKNGFGDVSIRGSVTNDVQCGSGNIEVDGDITGSVTTGSGNVRARLIQGSVKTGSGNIHTK